MQAEVYNYRILISGGYAKMINIRIAEPSDAEAILGIYSHYIKTTAITFEYEVPSIDIYRFRR